MRAIDLSDVTWRKSSYSNQDGGACLEVAADLPLVPVRDSKAPARGVLVFGAEAWGAFVGVYRSTSA
ncbi:DUF397 domain-containing protein [Streptomyces soliscabiei]|uniref:DUF397 domain-containing protein n=1 Tax=Streptomyces soliscabiei TaxID=588897 RepID=UPI0029AE8BD4|nr:DUF397 domain-containing protein [Streptomyces sp. NY05-11A]MDX2676908.1 DUF397 domain-containing protein [Streptomyces sp. NY05-11A]